MVRLHYNILAPNVYVAFAICFSAIRHFLLHGLVTNRSWWRDLDVSMRPLLVTLRIRCHLAPRLLGLLGLYLLGAQPMLQLPEIRDLSLQVIPLFDPLDRPLLEHPAPVGHLRLQELRLMGVRSSNPNLMLIVPRYEAPIQYLAIEPN